MTSFFFINIKKHIFKQCSMQICKFSPGQSESRESLHNLGAEVPLPGVVLKRHVQGMTEHVLYFIPVHHPHPLTPEGRTGALKNANQTNYTHT
jgi:hypothetical protein